MKKNLKVFIYFAIFVVIILLSVSLYNYLKDNYSPEEVKNEEEQFNKITDFTVIDEEGRQVNLSNYLGKPIIINFWATWCGPCKAELPEFEKMYNKYGREIEFLMINLTDGYNDTVDSVKKFVEENNYNFPLYFDTEYSASNAYKIYSIPQTLFIDENGNIIKSYIGMINNDILEKYIEKLISTEI